MADPDKFARVTLALVKDMEKRFPNVLPKTEVTPWELGTLQGFQACIRFLREQYERQNE